MVDTFLMLLWKCECHETLMICQHKFSYWMAWCHQAVSHYLNQYWPRFMIYAWSYGWPGLGFLWKKKNNFFQDTHSVAENFHGSSDICPMGFIYSIQLCEISHQTFWPSHRKCPTCPKIFVNTAPRKKWKKTIYELFSHFQTFLPKASFGLRVLPLPASVCGCVSVCLSVCHCQSRVCPCDNLSPI